MRLPAPSGLKAASRAAAFAAILAMAGTGPLAAQTSAPAAPAGLPNPETTVVAEVGEEKIYMIEILQLIQTLPQQYRQAPLQALYPALLDRAIDARLLTKAGKAAGVGESEEVVRRVESARNEIISEVFLTSQIDSRITDDALQARYKETVAQAESGEEIKARHILVEAEDTAKAIIEELKGGADFVELAKEKSTGPSGPNGGDLGWFTADVMVPEFSQAAMELKPGEITLAPVKTQFGYHVILVEDRRQQTPPSFEEMKDQLTQDMTRGLIQEILTEMRADASIKRFNPDGSPLGASQN